MRAFSAFFTLLGYFFAKWSGYLTTLRILDHETITNCSILNAILIFLAVGGCGGAEMAGLLTLE